ELHKCNAKDVLETETIKCAAVRHKLMHFPDEINREIHGKFKCIGCLESKFAILTLCFFNLDTLEAVLVARQSNEAFIDRVKKQLEQLQCETDQVEQQATKVEAENNALRPELDSLKEAHDANFVRLNELLAEKAARQIELNEMRESIRRASSRIVDLEEDTVLLAEQMVEERQQYADTMRSIREQTYEVEHQLKDCTDKEDKKSREFLAVHATLEESKSELGELVQEHNSLEHGIAMLQVQHQDSVKQQAQVQAKSQQLKTNIEALSTQSRVLEAEHQTQVAEMQKTLEDLEVKTQQQTVKKEKVVAQKTEVTARTVAVATKVKEETSKDSEEKKQILAQAKKAVAAKESDLVKMRQEILDMEGRHAELEDAERQETANVSEEASAMPSATVMEIQDTIEMHRRRRQQREARLAKEAGGRPALFRRATEFDINSVLGFNRQIAEWKEKLEQETAERNLSFINRLTVQSVSEKLQADIKEFNANEAAETSAINQEIDKLKHEKAALEAEQARLQSAMRADEARQSTLADRLQDERRQLEEWRSAREAEAEALTVEIEQLRQEAASRAAELEDLAPKFSEFEDFYRRSISDYDALKRSLVAMKNRKAGLEASSNKAGHEIDRLTQEIARLQRDKELRKAQSAQELESMVDDRVKLEREIYVLGCKLQTVLAENAKLTSGVDRLERQMRTMQSSWERAVPAKARTEQHRGRLAVQLESGRRRDFQLAEEFQNKDRHFLTALAAIINDTEARQAIVEAVAEKLESELDCLDEFLKTSKDDN
uniref:GRIP domain-containing protein n=1 Tax=Macrostomum lignano TaxID=282301 RepID=A0A1I8HJZ8_9PLAT